MRQQAAVCPPVLSNGTKKKAFGRKLMLENCSFRSGPFWVKLHWTQHGFGFSVCCVIRPWPAFCAPDPCPISSEPNETISPVHSVLSLLVQSSVRNDYLSQIFKLPVSSLYANFHTQWYCHPLSHDASVDKNSCTYQTVHFCTQLGKFVNPRL